MLVSVEDTAHSVFLVPFPVNDRPILWHRQADTPPIRSCLCSSFPPESTLAAAYRPHRPSWRRRNLLEDHIRTDDLGVPRFYLGYLLSALGMHGSQGLLHLIDPVYPGLPISNWGVLIVLIAKLPRLLIQFSLDKAMLPHRSGIVKINRFFTF